jgi:triacylglycerol lipase
MSVPARDDLGPQLRSLGVELTPDQIQATMELMAPHAPRPGPDVVVHRDVAYGPDPRHRLDVFVPAAGTPIERSRMDVAGNDRSLAEERWAGDDRAPVLVFVHGGGFVMGDKGAPDAPFYNNVGLWAARSGCIGVTMTYRLAPAAPWPAGSEDVGAAVQFLHGAVERWGGDPKGIFLMGQSAGAVHVAGYVAEPRLHLVPHGGIAGAIMISGLFDVARADRNPFQAAYFGEDPTRWPEQSTLGRLAGTSLRCFYSVSEFDPPDFQRQAAWLVEACAARQGRWPRMIQLTGHNHLSSVLQIGSGMDTLGPELLRFILRA